MRQTPAWFYGIYLVSLYLQCGNKCLQSEKKRKFNRPLPVNFDSELCSKNKQKGQLKHNAIT